LHDQIRNRTGRKYARGGDQDVHANRLYTSRRR
jgi:hypothetical protein